MHITPPLPLLEEIAVWHYIFGRGQAREYRAWNRHVFWLVQFANGYSTWINRTALTVLDPIT